VNSTTSSQPTVGRRPFRATILRFRRPAGDNFVLPSLLPYALRKQAGTDLEISELELRPPDVPFGDVADVDEASGTEEEMIEALRGVRIWSLRWHR
jgi:hypothetical protein